MTEIKILLMGLVSGFAYLLGGWDKGLEYLIIAVAVDYFFGIITALYTQSFNIKTGYMGILKKLGFFGIVAVAVIVEKSLGQPDTIHPMVCFALVVNEGFSTLRNLKILGVPIPDIFYKQMEDLQAKSGGGKSES